MQQNTISKSEKLRSMFMVITNCSKAHYMHWYYTEWFPYTPWQGTCVAKNATYTIFGALAVH